MVVKKRRFGKSDVEVSEISFGCGGFWGFPVFPEKEAQRIIELALESGVNFFDTGPNYSSGNAEPRLGRILKSRWDDVMVATKVGSRLSPDGKLIRDFSPAAIRSSVAESLRRLGTDHVHLLQFHSPGMSVLENDDSVKTMVSLREEGVASSIGLSAGGKIAEKAIALGVFDSLMTTYNVIKNSTAPLMETAARAGIAVLVRAPMAGAVYSPSFYKVRSISQVWYILRALKNSPDDLMRARKLWFMNRLEGLKSTQVALRFTLDNPNVTSAIVGTTKIGHLADNLAVSSLPPLAPELAQRIMRVSR